MSFHEVQFPTGISYGSEGGPGFMTDIVQVDSGAEERIARWTNARRGYDVAYGIKSYSDLYDLQKFFIARLGAANGFRYKDWLDYTSADDGMTAPTTVDVVIGNGDASETAYQLVKFYASGAITRTRVITKPVVGSVIIALDGVELDSAYYSVNSTTGIVTFNTAPGLGVSITAGFTFDVPVRFDKGTDTLLSLSLEDFSSGSASVKLVELIGDVETPEEHYYGGSLTTDPMTADQTLSYGDGRAIVVNPNSSSRIINLPDPAAGQRGDPQFHIINISSSNDVIVKRSGSTVVTIGPSSGRALLIALNASSVPTWYYY